MQNDIKQELGTNFIEYAVAVITDRAMPDSKSGLKPVAKRIIYSTFEKGRLNNKPHVKAARIVGDVMGEYHPHGDSSIYGALVRLSQNWVMRYPLIDWHGNNGNIIGDGPAHMRYTEARLAKITEDGMLEGIKKKNVDFIDNYDETKDEPITLPSIFPNLLCNPNKGIGVGMACNWLPHNLREVAQCIYDYIDGKEFFLPGPDFPTGGIVINKDDIPEIMRTGHGSIKVRGRYKINKQKIVFYEIPYGTTIEGILDEIGSLCEEKTIEGIDEIRDESDKKGINIVIECSKDTNPESIVNKLFMKSSLQSSISYNQVALVSKTPTELNLEDCLKIYLEHNEDCLIKEINFDLNKAKVRKEIVEGLLIALEHIDNVISLIKSSSSTKEAKERLANKYGFSENQVQAVVDMKLSRLTKLEKIEVENELKELIGKIKNFEKILNSKELRIAEIRKRLENIVKKYGDDRKTELLQIEVKDKEVEEVIPEDVVVILSHSGNIKKIPKKSFKVQKRNGKGVKSEDDAVLECISTNTVDNLMLFTSKGKMYRLLVDNVPTGTNISKGTNLNTLIKIAEDEKIIAMTSLYHQSSAKYVVFITKNGLLKKSSLDEYTKVKRSTGIAAINIKANDSIANVIFMEEEDIVLITKNGMSIRFSTDDISPIGRVTSGVKAIKLEDNDEVIVGLPIHKKTDYIAVFTSNGYAKRCALDDLPYQLRAGKGVIIYKPTDLTGKIIGSEMIDNEDNILLVGKPNSICIASTDIPILNRISTGNIMIKNEVKSIVKL